MKIIQGILVDRPTGRQNSIKAIFFEGGHNNYICIWNINLKYASLQKLAETEILYFIFFLQSSRGTIKKSSDQNQIQT